MNHETLKTILEGAILAAAQPMPMDRILKLFAEEERPGHEELKAALDDLQNDYADRGIELKEVASGYRFQVRQEYTPWVSRLWEEKPSRYSRALLETLALIAYRQPITRSEIEDIRGVSVSSTIMKTLQEREWTRVVGHRDVPGRPAMYATTRQFLDYFDLKSLDELPPLAELRDLDEFEERVRAAVEQPFDEVAEDIVAYDVADADAEEAVAVTVESEIDEPMAQETGFDGDDRVMTETAEETELQPESELVGADALAAYGDSEVDVSMNFEYVEAVDARDVAVAYDAMDIEFDLADDDDPDRSLGDETLVEEGVAADEVVEH